MSSNVMKLIESIPKNNDTNVYLNATFRLRFDKELDPSSVNNRNIKLYRLPENTIINIDIKIDQNDPTVVLVDPHDPLLPTTEHIIVIIGDPNIADDIPRGLLAIDGSVLDKNISIKFTSGTTLESADADFEYEGERFDYFSVIPESNLLNKRKMDPVIIFTFSKQINSIVNDLLGHISVTYRIMPNLLYHNSFIVPITDIEIDGRKLIINLDVVDDNFLFDKELTVSIDQDILESPDGRNKAIQYRIITPAKCIFIDPKLVSNIYGLSEEDALRIVYYLSLKLSSFYPDIYIVAPHLASEFILLSIKREMMMDTMATTFGIASQRLLGAQVDYYGGSNKTAELKAINDQLVNVINAIRAIYGKTPVNSIKSYMEIIARGRRTRVIDFFENLQ